MTIFFQNVMVIYKMTLFTLLQQSNLILIIRCNLHKDYIVKEITKKKLIKTIIDDGSYGLE